MEYQIKKMIKFIGLHTVELYIVLLASYMLTELMLGKFPDFFVSHRHFVLGYLFTLTTMCLAGYTFARLWYRRKKSR